VRLLVLGGGGFLGFHVVDAAVRAGHEVTVFGRSGRSEVDGVEALTGDRTGGTDSAADLDALRGRSWDAVVDTFTDPAPGAPAVRRTAELLRGAVDRYCSVSGMSVYAPSGPPVPDETAPVRRSGVEPDDDPLQERSLAKLAAEDAVGDVFGEAGFFPRVGIMVGPRDPSHRFTYWPVRFARALAGTASRTVLAPGDPARPVQYSDARDVARWIVDSLAAGRSGAWNTVGPGRADALRDVLAACLAAAGGSGDDVTLDWRPEAELSDRLDGIEDEDRPLWFPEPQIPQAAIDSDRAVAAGLTFRPALDTARDTLAWAREAGDDALAGGPFEQRVDAFA
jgi:2'-hydroxyisoflavone reductase